MCIRDRPNTPKGGGISRKIFNSSDRQKIRSILNEIDIPVQGGLNPQKLLEDKATLKQEVKKYLKVFKNHPYIFNLGHGIQPQTKIEMVEKLVKTVRSFN